MNPEFSHTEWQLAYYMSITLITLILLGDIGEHFKLPQPQRHFCDILSPQNVSDVFHKWREGGADPP